MFDAADLLFFRAGSEAMFALLLCSLSPAFFRTRMPETPPVFLLALSVRRSRLTEGNGDCLLSAFHFSTFAGSAAFQFPVLEFMHDAASRLAPAF